MVKQLNRALQSGYFIGFFLILVLLTHIPTGKGVLLGDDFTQWAATTAPAVLAEKGLPLADPNNDWLTRISNAFLFLSADNNETAALKQYGAVPWWVPDTVTMHMFRPLTAITHWFDYQYLATDVFLMQLHSVLYLLLLVASYYVLCRVIGAPNWVAAVAVILFTYSYSMPQNLNWLAARNAIIAPMFALWVLVLHHRWRTRQQLWYLLFSLVALLLALLAAEAGIAVLAYLGAYMLLLDKAPFWQRVATLVPALLVVVVWRLGYSLQGFGTENIALYVDPVRSPGAFITERLPMLPIYYARVLLGPLAMGLLTLTSSVYLLSLLSLGLCLLLLWPFYSQLKNNRLMQFALLGSLVAIIPFLSTNPGPRTEPFLHLGFMLFVASWLYGLSQTQQVSKGIKVFAAILLVLHLLIPGVLTVGRHWRLLTLEVKPVDAYSSVANELATQPKDLVIVNSPDYFTYYHRPLSWAHDGLALPEQMHLLAPGLTAMTIERIDKDRYRLTSTEGFALNADTPRDLDGRDDPQRHRNKVLAYRANNQIMTNTKTHFNLGDVFHIGHQPQTADSHEPVLTITVIALQAKTSNAIPMPTKLEVRFASDRDMVWQWFDWQDKRYKKFTPLQVGEQRNIAGPFTPLAVQKN